MSHRYTLHLVPADLDRLEGILQRAGVATPGNWDSSAQLLADIDRLAALVRASGKDSLAGRIARAGGGRG